ncbi:MAG: triose-phosphate isomerase [Pseudomonadota bacterium]
MPQKIAAGNWKMNGTRASLAEAEAIAAGAPAGITTLICPPATLLSHMPQSLAAGGQACHANSSGPHTGDLSAEMLADAGATWCLAGHSERRQDHGETDAAIAAQIAAIWRAGMKAILCIGETLEQRQSDLTLTILMGQIDGSMPQGATAENLALAYEPVWAIGTGQVATPDQVAEVHDALRDRLGPDMSLLYGGSVKAANAAELFALTNVDGALVGGASLKAADFLPVAEALAAS